jgi:hypothetical protein
MERSDYSLQSLMGPSIVAPVSPFWTIFDMIQLNTVQSYDWVWNVPNDGMVYQLAQMTYVEWYSGWIACAVFCDGVNIFNRFEGYNCIWRPGVKSAPLFKFPNVILFRLVHMFNVAYWHYWQMDFWRTPEGGL